MTVYKHMPSFAGGEISPALYGRTDFAKYDNGAATLQNFMVLRYGGITNRAGTKYVMTCPGFAVLRAFRYSASENYILVFSAKRIQVCYGGKEVTLLATVATPYKADELRLIKYTQSADEVYLVHPNHPPYVLTRKAHNNWTIAPMDITKGPFEDPDTSGLSITPSGTTGNITLTASGSYFTSDMVGNLMKIGHTVPSQYVSGTPGSTGTDTKTVSSYAYSGTTTDLSDAPTGYSLKSINCTAASYTYDSVNNTITIPDEEERNIYTVTRVFIKANANLQVSCVPGGTVYVESFGFWSGNFTLEKYVDGSWTKIRTQEGNHSSNYSFTETNNDDEIIDYRITTTNFDTTIWEDENEKQVGHVTLQSFSQDYYGIAEIKTVASDGKSATATVKIKLGSVKASTDFSISPWSSNKGYPCCAGFFEDRLVLAGNKKFGQTFWTSKSGDYYNFGTSIPSEDTDGIVATLNGGEMNGIKAMIPFGEMLMLTAGGEYKVSGNNDALSPSNVRSTAQEYRGISDVAPVTVGSRIVYVQQQGSIIRDLGYQYDVDKYTGDDLTLLADHLFRKHTVVSIAYQQAPNSIVWCVRDDGLLLGLTYIKEQDIYAWHKHTTKDGSFIDVACIAGDDEDELWCVVKRNGKYYVEVMAPRNKTDEVTEQYFVDSGVTYSGDGAMEVSGLDHLEGQTVSILADGFVLPQQVVASGKVTFDHSYKKIHVGLPIDAVFESLPVELQGQDGSYLSRKKRIAKVMIMFFESRGGKYGLSEDGMDEMKWRSTEVYGAPINLYTGKKEIIMPAANYSETQQIVVKQEDPLPLTILAMVPEIGG